MARAGVQLFECNAYDGARDDGRAKGACQNKLYGGEDGRDAGTAGGNTVEGQAQVLHCWRSPWLALIDLVKLAHLQMTYWQFLQMF